MHNDQAEIQDCIAFIKWWNETTATNTVTLVSGETTTDWDSSQTGVKLLIPANRTFVVDRTGVGAPGLNLTSSITIEGEDRLTSVIRLQENSVEPTPTPTPTQTPAATPSLITGEDGGVVNSDGENYGLFYSHDGGITRITFRNFMVRGSYGTTASPGPGKVGSRYSLSHGVASLFTFNDFTDVLFEDMVFTRNRAVIIAGGGSRNFTMRGCLLSESRRGGVIITDAENTVIEDNDFRWVADDPVAITLGGTGGDAQYRYVGGTARIVGNRLFGCRGLNVVGAKNVLITDNTCVLCRGRAIHIGTVTDQAKGNTTMLNIIVRDNIITDLLDAQVDPDQDQNTGSHRAIDIEMLQAGVDANGSIPGLPNSGGHFIDPATYYYQEGQGLQGRDSWKPRTKYAVGAKVWWLGRLYTCASVTDNAKSDASGPTGEISPVIDNHVQWTFDGRATTPYSANILVEGNVISRSRLPVAHFTDYQVGFWGGFDHEYAAGEPAVSADQIQPNEGIALSGSVRHLLTRGNQIRNCAVGILLDGRKLPMPFSMLDVKIEGNDLSDWTGAGIRFVDFTYDDGLGVFTYQAQRVSVLNNKADGDPFHRSGARKLSGGISDGTWNNVSDCSFVDTNGVPGLLIAGNHARNVSQLVSGLAGARPTMEGNVAYYNVPPLPAVGSLGYNAGNVGIGNLIAPQLGWRYVIEDGNPASSTYGQVLNPCPLGLLHSSSDATLPDQGTTPLAWVEGTIVANLNPNKLGTTNGYYEIWSWRRMTTGAGNTLNTDWRPLKVSVPN